MLPSADCIVSEKVCCTSFYDIADNILAGILLALQACIEPSPCNGGGWHAYVTMGDGDDGMRDALSVAITKVAPSANSQAQGKLAPVSMMLVTYRVRIIESGWPTVHIEEDTIFQPDPVEQNQLARHAYGHGEMMWRKLTSMATKGELMPPGYSCSATTVGPLTPLKPSGGTVGFFAEVTLTLPWGA